MTWLNQRDFNCDTFKVPRDYFVFAKLNLNSTQLNFNFNFEAEIALFSDNTDTHPPNRESSKMEQDFKYFN